MKINIIFGITPELAETLNGLSAAIASPNIAGILKEAAETAVRLRKAPPIPTYPEGGVPAGNGLKMAGESGPETIAPGSFRFVDPAMHNPEPEDEGTGDPTPGFGEALESYKREQDKLAEGLAPDPLQNVDWNSDAEEALAREQEAAHKANLKTDAELQAAAAAVPGLNEFQNRPTEAPAPLTEEELEEQRKEARRIKDRERKAAKREAEAAKNQPKTARIDPEPDEPLIVDHAEPTNGAAASNGHANGQPVAGVEKDALIAATQNAIFKDPANRDKIREYLDSAEVGKVTELSEAAWPAFISFAEAL